MNTTITSKRLSAVLAFIVAFAVAAVMAISPAAFAADTPNAIGNIEAGKTGSLTIHKYTAPAFGEKGNGSEITEGLPSESRKLDGAKFKVQKVTNIDLTTVAGWKALKTATPQSVAGSLDAGTEQVTANGGVAKFSNLAQGLYLVTETEKPANVTTEAAPFLVTIPFSTEGQTNAVPGAVNGWLYDVHVYPKNEINTKLNKKLADTQTAIQKGDDLNWELSIPVPTTAKALASFKIEDTLKNGTVFSNANEPVLTLDGTALATTDYTVSGKGTANAVITFTTAGVKKLNQKAGKILVVNLYATVAADLGTNKVVNDDFKTTYTIAQKPFDPNNPDTPNPEDPNTPPTTDTYTPPTDPNDVPTAYFGDYVISKQSTVGNTPIDGAVFKIYANKADADADAAGTQAIATAEAVAGTAGKLIFKDLYLGRTAAATKTFYLVETKAPTGFKLDPANNKEITISHTDAEPAAVVVTNAPFGDEDLPDLPLTGAAGKVLLTLGGIAIVMLAAGTVLATRRRKA